MKKFNWVDYPENAPSESGLYVVNFAIGNWTSNTLAFYEKHNGVWYTSTDKYAKLLGVNAFKSEIIIPYIKN